MRLCLFISFSQELQFCVTYCLIIENSFPLHSVQFSSCLEQKGQSSTSCPIMARNKSHNMSYEVSQYPGNFQLCILSPKMLSKTLSFHGNLLGLENFFLFQLGTPMSELQDMTNINQACPLQLFHQYCTQWELGITINILIPDSENLSLRSLQY